MNPFNGIYTALDQVMNLLGRDCAVAVQMEVSAEDMILVLGGWVCVGQNRWRHPDAPKDESMSGYFARLVQKRLDRWANDGRTFLGPYTQYYLAVGAVQFDVYSD